jgi:predicted RNA-binding Zn ribbon-like protein
MKPSDFTPPPDKIPAGWKTAAQWAKQWKLQERQTSHILRAALESGQVRRKLFRTRSGVSLRPVPHYAAA